MSWGTAEIAIRGQALRWAKIKQNNLITTGTDFRTRVDAAADFTYEDRITGAIITTLDTEAAAGNLGRNSAFTPWFDEHKKYFVIDLGYTGYGLDGYLTAKRWRVPEELAEMYYEYYRERLTAANVCPSDIIARGGITKGTPDLVSLQYQVDADITGLGGLVGKVVTKGAIDWTITVTATFDADETDTVTPQIVVAGAAPVGTEYPVGEVAPTGPTEAAGATVIEMADTSPFKAGYTVLLYDDNAQEVATVNTVNTNTSLVLSTGILHTYTSAATFKVRPLYHHLTALSATGGTAADQVTFYTLPDGAPAL